MASGGAMITGTDGTDFHYRQQVAAPHQIRLNFYFIYTILNHLFFFSILNKSRLKYCIFFHSLLFFVMLAKLTPDILDRLDIFVMEIEELQIPQPLWWEYTWCISILSSFVGLSAAKGNKIREMKKFMVLVFVFGILPIAYCLLHYFSNVWDYLFLEDGNNLDESGILLWKDYPYCILWYAFCIIGVQIHLFTILFSWNLLKAWNARIAARKYQ